MKTLKRFLTMVLSISLICSYPHLVVASEISPEQNIAAQWVANAVKITFNANGGGIPPHVQVYTFGVERSLPGVCSMQKSGYIFKGWAESSSATAPDWLPGATSDEAFGYADETKAIAKTLYAVWEQDTSASLLARMDALEAEVNVLKTSQSLGAGGGIRAKCVKTCRGGVNTGSTDASIYSISYIGGPGFAIVYPQTIGYTIGNQLYYLSGVYDVRIDGNDKFGLDYSATTNYREYLEPLTFYFNESISMYCYSPVAIYEYI